MGQLANLEEHTDMRCLHEVLSDGSACKRAAHHLQSAWSDSMKVALITKTFKTKEQHQAMRTRQLLQAGRIIKMAMQEIPVNVM